MSDIQIAKRLFDEDGLAFPELPEKFEAHLKELDKWVFASREVATTPFNIQHYISELDADRTSVEDYVILSHSGYGINSYALQYYLVYRGLELFLHLSYGGVYMDAEESRADISECFAIADKIVLKAKNLSMKNQLRIVGSNAYGSYWSLSGAKHLELKKPKEVLLEALEWLNKMDE